MKIYGRSRFGFHGVVLDEKDKVITECNHTHLTRTSAERCAKGLADKERKKLVTDQDS
jgi:hypothetical protein